MTTIADELLRSFLQTCTHELQDCCTTAVHNTTTFSSISQIRQSLLDQQRSCLARIVSDWNNNNQQQNTAVTAEQVQLALRQQQSDSSLEVDLNALNDAARLAFCSLVLDSNFSVDDKGTTLQRKDIFEFCGLCTGAVRLERVQRHLYTGAPLLSSSKEQEETSSILPQKRLEAIQRHFLQALGYDPDIGTYEIKRIFFTPTPNEYSDDRELADVFSNLLQTMNGVVTNASLTAQQSLFSDHDRGGVTRVVAVNFSEKVVGDGEEEHPDATAPVGERMEQHTEKQQRAVFTDCA
jgi:hypothetical protein